ncbi:hypothetical protein SAMN04487950_1332 [Halogranum rubrum]|uniref:Uncharacterized protein n=1 Tax=Halogranum rubrum TaxID=553466 RepID=A0A1I4CRL7_9EURY|nr:hypothetical protein [Halogranum rubrum]SFK83270.1 hypothetical protein SAMN04487950_1332 [Halogranum rubrum]
MTNNPAGLLVVFAFVAAAIGSVPLAVVAFLLAGRVRPFSRAVLYAGGAVGVVAAVLAVVVTIISPAAGLVVAVLAVLTAAVLWAVPLLVARAVLVRRGLDGQRALRNATVGLPVALVASLFVVFGDFRRYNITFLTGTEALVAWTALVLVVFLGPTAVGLGVTALRR